MILSHAEVRDLAAAYVLDALDRETAAAIRAHLAECTEPHPELAELGQPAAALAYLAEPVAPPPALRSRVLAAVRDVAQETPQAARATAVATIQPAAAVQPAAAPARPMPAATLAEPAVGGAGFRPRLRRPVLLRWAAVAVAAVLIVALTGANLLVGQSLSSANQRVDRLDQALSLAAQPGSRVALMAPPRPGSSAGGAAAQPPGGLAVIGADGKGVMLMRSLPATSGSQVYEAWAIVGTNAPVPAGAFTVGSDGTGWLDSMTGPASGTFTVGLTLEKGPGATRPTLPLVAAGSAAPPG